jgi:flagellin
MTSSVHTNLGALGALQSLGGINTSLSATQNRVSSGLKVQGAKDDGALYHVAQAQRAEFKAFDAISAGLDRAKSSIDVALAAGSAVSDLFMQMREKAVAASDSSISATSRAAYNVEFVALRDQIGQVLSAAVFDGTNLLNGPAGTLNYQASTNGTQSVSVPVLDLSLPAAPGAIASPAAGIYLGAGADLTSAANAQDARDRAAASLEFVNSQMTRLGAAGKRIETQRNFIGRLQDGIKGGIGHLVDADMAAESARLSSLQTKQQLGTQALSLANQSPQALLNLLRS